MLVVLATIAGSLGSWWWGLDLLSAFRVQYLVVLAAVAVLHFALGGRVSGSVMLLAGLVNLSLVLPYLLGAGPDGDAPGLRMQVMSFNVGVSNPARGEVARYAAEVAPDLLFVFESSFEWEDALYEEGPAMAIVAIVPRGRVAGITVLADPALQARSIPVPFGGPAEAAAVEVLFDGVPVTVLGLHPPSPTGHSRAATRDRLLAEAADWISGRDGAVLVIGDLNATPWSHAYRSLRLRTGMVDSLSGAGLQPTWPAGWGPLMVPIDHALHTGDLVTVERRTGPPFGSAHRPLLVTVAAG
jgi:endonuclease/exonuclease/phosphatase (EEP) superfamily protein YafD